MCPHGFLSSLAGLVLILFTLPTDQSVGYFLSPSGLGKGYALMSQRLAKAPESLDDVSRLVFDDDESSRTASRARRTSSPAGTTENSPPFQRWELIFAKAQSPGGAE